MAAEVIIDIIDGRGHGTLEKGWEFDRIAVVKGLVASGAAAMQSAVESLWTLKGIRFGVGHPSRPSCLLYDIVPEIIDSDTVRLILSYSDSYLRGFNTAEIGANVTQQETNQNAVGIGIFAAYPDKTNQGKFISKFIPEMTISLTRLMDNNGILETNPQWKAMNFVGKVNEGGWSLHGSALPRTWLCTGITGHSPDHGTTWWVTYTFLYRPNNFDVKVVWVDEDGFPPPDADTYSWQIYTMIDFNLLGNLA